ncbi:hypothetical protein TcWFU_002583 [Taenia crassiceps]|uniref:Uncharacterized protein n=1 Tax=Taenia crassiceps TaxID=6207 RepID=A0ABR4QAR7_9CEST
MEKRPRMGSLHHPDREGSALLVQNRSCNGRFSSFFLEQDVVNLLGDYYIRVKSLPSNLKGHTPKVDYNPPGVQSLQRSGTSQLASKYGMTSWHTIMDVAIGYSSCSDSSLSLDSLQRCCLLLELRETGTARSQDPDLS